MACEEGYGATGLVAWHGCQGDINDAVDGGDGVGGVTWVDSVARA